VVSEEAVAEVFVALKEVTPNQSKVNLEEANGVEKVKVKRKVQAPEYYTKRVLLVMVKARMRIHHFR
jgi:hypothetical protein